jgi:hypothetical protein
VAKVTPLELPLVRLAVVVLSGREMQVLRSELVENMVRLKSSVQLIMTGIKSTDNRRGPMFPRYEGSL